ncbi:MAG: TetR/AcrR family transcriptional regulator [Acidimicrobiales bacterium]
MTRREYTSPRRAAQAAATREAILDATIVVMGEGVESFSIPAVAARAGVSVPTVYRYFPDKEALLDAAAERVRDGLGVSADQPSPTDVEDYLDSHRQIFRRFSAADPTTIGAVVATFGRGRGALDLDARRVWLAPAFDGALESWSDEDRERLLGIASILNSSVGATAFAQFGLHGDDAADLFEWTIRRLLSSSAPDPSPKLTETNR